MVDDATVPTSSQTQHQQVNMALPVVKPAYLLSILHTYCHTCIPVLAIPALIVPFSACLSLFEHITESSYVCTAQSLSPKSL